MRFIALRNTVPRNGTAHVVFVLKIGCLVMLLFGRFVLPR